MFTNPLDVAKVAFVMEHNADSQTTQPLRIWPVFFLLALMPTIRLIPNWWTDGPAALPYVAALGPIACSLLLVIWWLAFSRAKRGERVLGLLALSGLGFATYALSHPTMKTVVTMLFWSVPLGIGAFGLGVLLFRRKAAYARTVLALFIASAGFGVGALLRSEGMWGSAEIEVHWRWTLTAEELMLAEREVLPNRTPSPDNTANEGTLPTPDWPGFRGPNRDGRQRGTRLATDWKTEPPELLWKNKVGPAWSSFAVAGNLIFTQEQRGPQECVVCYNADDGTEVWVQQIEARFTEAMGGPGPRATPQLADDAVYALGAKGDLLKLNPLSGALTWRVNIGEAAKRDLPTWGYSSSPLILHDFVIVHAGGDDNRGILAFRTDNGGLAWSAPSGDHSYASPHAITIDNEPLVVMASNAGMNFLNPTNGHVRLDYPWPINGYRALQPQMADNDTLILATQMGTGTRRIRVQSSTEGLKAEDVWTTRFLKADFNDFVVYQDHIYGFDGGIFACVGLDDGKRRWKGGRYGLGQVLLLEDSGHLFVLGERGQGVLLEATPEALTELTSTTLLDGKTWNHPVIVSDRLYIRNSQEAACYRLPLAPPQ